MSEVTWKLCQPHSSKSLTPLYNKDTGSFFLFNLKASHSLHLLFLSFNFFPPPLTLPLSIHPLVTDVNPNLDFQILKGRLSCRVLERGYWGIGYSYVSRRGWKHWGMKQWQHQEQRNSRSAINHLVEQTGSAIRSTQRTGHCTEEGYFFSSKAVGSKAGVLYDLRPSSWVWITGHRVTSGRTKDLQLLKS